MTYADLPILLPALVAGLLVLATHIPFGMKIIERGVIFADLAVAQIAGLGVITAGLLGLQQTHPLLLQTVAGGSALAGAALLVWIERRLPHVKEAAIGLTFVLAASASVLLMSRDVHAGEHLQELLVGQILWIGENQLLALGGLSALLLTLWRWPALRQHPFGFYSLFALAVTASVQLAGVYLVFASLIVPALATLRCARHRIAFAFLVGLGGYALGLLGSVWFDLPAGAAIVWAMSACGAAVALWQRA
jgi:zinc/manganese transport system permease protein